MDAESQAERGSKSLEAMFGIFPARLSVKQRMYCKLKVKRNNDRIDYYI